MRHVTVALCPLGQSGENLGDVRVADHARGVSVSDVLADATPPCADQNCLIGAQSDTGTLRF